MFRVQFFCPRQSREWQILTGFLGFFPREFSTIAEAAAEADGLIWQYHSARVVNGVGRVVYQV